MREVAVTDDVVGTDDEVAELWAASGAQWLTDPGVGVPGRLVRTVIGIVDALDRRGAGLAEILPARGLGVLAERSASMGLPCSGRTSCGGASRLLRAGDGWFVLSLARDDDRDLVPAWLEADVGLGEEPWFEIERIAARRPVDELVSRGAMLGLPCGAVGEVQDGRPVLLDSVGAAAPRPVAGALVVSLAALWAGPLCADVLGRLGARVITVESTRRPDGGRQARRFFRALHGRSESFALDITTPRGQELLGSLLRAADVVIEGSRPRAIEQMGIDALEVVESGPQAWLSITAQGRGSGVRDRVGFGDDAAATGGLVGWIGDEPRFVADAVADPLTGLTAALAVTELLEAGGRWLADVALARTARAATGGWIGRSRASEHPRARIDRGGPLPLGRDTSSVIREFGIA